MVCERRMARAGAAALTWKGSVSPLAAGKSTSCVRDQSAYASWLRATWRRSSGAESAQQRRRRCRRTPARRGSEHRRDEKHDRRYKSLG
eukprot:1105386-Prorocentrum_minimum.AAC.1